MTAQTPRLQKREPDNWTFEWDWLRDICTICLLFRASWNPKKNKQKNSKKLSSQRSSRSCRIESKTREPEDGTTNETLQDNSPARPTAWGCRSTSEICSKVSWTRKLIRKFRGSCNRKKFISKHRKAFIDDFPQIAFRSVGISNSTLFASMIRKLISDLEKKASLMTDLMEVGGRSEGSLMMK